MSAKEKLKSEILKKAVVHGKVILSSGKEADYYVDLRRVTLDSTALARAITGAASKVSTEAVMNFQDLGITITESFDTLFNKYVTAGTGDGRSGSGLNITSKTQTDQDIDDYFFQMLEQDREMGNRLNRL